MANLMGKMVGAKYQEFLDNISAYYYFPIAIAKENAVSDAIIQVNVRPISGSIDRAGGLVFGLMNVGNYFVLRINALENNFNLFEFINDRRFQRASVHRKIKPAEWYRIKAETSGQTLKGYLDDELLIEYTAERPLNGYVGIWTKADSVTCFDALTINENSNKRVVEFHSLG
jgi:pyruvate,water dikinase